MRFAIGLTEYFDDLGFNTKHWRKSLDGEYAIVHYDTVQHLADDAHIEVYWHDDAEFIDLLTGSEWSEDEDE